MVITALSDVQIAILRITKILTAEEQVHGLIIDPRSEFAVEAVGDFAYETAIPPDQLASGPRPGDKKANKEARKKDKAERKAMKTGNVVEGSTSAEEKDENELKPFTLTDINLHIERGSFLCIFGRIGSGKTALLEGLLGEMRQTRGLPVKFNGSISLVTQTPWIQSASLKDNILFGQPMDSARLQKTIHACALTRDLEQLSDGINTEIGGECLSHQREAIFSVLTFRDRLQERGINLSGGQRSRVALARAAYSEAEVVILDDPLSAVDSHGKFLHSASGISQLMWLKCLVSAHLTKHCLLGSMKDKTRILVTHHLEVAQHADLILVMDQGRIIQQGTYDALKKTAGIFQTLIEEYGNAKKEDADSLEVIDDTADGKQAISQKHRHSETTAETSNTTDTDEKAVTKIHVDEELLTGAISGKTFMAYLKAMSKGGPLVMALSGAVLTECVAIALTLILGFWTTSSISGFGQSQYMGLYAGLGVAVAVFSFVGTYSTYLCGIGASFLMAQQALSAVLRSPVSFHDRTPSGRIISRLTKDIETMDDRLSNHIYWLLGGILSIMGTIGLVFYTFPYLGLVFIPMFAVYYLIGVVYARAARQVRRINSTMRSYVYSAFGEQLSGVVSIRAYQQQQAFSDKFSAALDNEGRFYYIIIFSNIWLSLRLDLLGSILILGIGIFGVCFRNDVSPAKLSVVLTYSLQTTQVSFLVPHRFRLFMPDGNLFKDV